MAQFYFFSGHKKWLHFLTQEAFVPYGIVLVVRVRVRKTSISAFNCTFLKFGAVWSKIFNHRKMPHTAARLAVSLASFVGLMGPRNKNVHQTWDLLKFSGLCLKAVPYSGGPALEKR